MQKISSPLILVLGLFLFLNCCAQVPLDKQKNTRSSLFRVDTENLPHFTDDLQLEGLLTGAVRHLHYLNKLPETASFTFGSDTYPVSWLRESINSLIDVLKQDPDSKELARIIDENFVVYQAIGRKQHTQGTMLVTGYYEPFLNGSLTRQAPYLYPLYAPPESLVLTRDPQSGKKLFKRRNKAKQIVPFWTRREIEEQGIADGYELVYLDNPVDAFILHVQGSGKIQLQDGSVRSIHYAASNGREYFSIGKLLVDQGKMTLDEASIPSIRKYLRDHPEEMKDILYHNKKYIFFNWAPAGDPVGSLGEPLVAGRSVAVDQKVLPVTSLAFLKSRKPVLDASGSIVKWVAMHRFVFPQDSGAAIKGSGRVDLYWGSGEYARQAAGSMKEEGTLYFLVKNNYEKTEKK